MHDSSDPQIQACTHSHTHTQRERECKNDFPAMLEEMHTSIHLNDPWLLVRNPCVGNNSLNQRTTNLCIVCRSF